MIKAVAGRADGTPSTVFLGLTRENLDRLPGNQPIAVKLHELDPRLPELTIVLLGGQTEDEIVEDLRALGMRRGHERRD